MNTYVFTLDWYNEITDTEEKIKGFVFGEKYSDAVKVISSRFSDMYNLYINLMPECDGFVFIDDEETFDKVVKENACIA